MATAVEYNGFDAGRGVTVAEAMGPGNGQERAAGLETERGFLVSWYEAWHRADHRGTRLRRACRGAHRPLT